MKGGAPRVVLDTNVVLSLFVFADSRLAPIRQALEDRRWLAVTNPGCLAEFRRVLGYPMFGLDSAAQAAAYDAYAALSSDAGGKPRGQAPLPLCRDRDDQKFLELARDAAADLLVTSDKALLKLARRGRLKALFRILAPEMALALIASGDSAIVGAGES